MAKLQIGTPLVVDGSQVRKLERVGLGAGSFSEERLQTLLFDHPSLLPTDELEPVFDGLISVCRELPTAAGPLDLFYVTAGGNLCLVETKLWRNPEARRSVVAQLIDYAKEIAGWGYSELIGAISRARATTAPITGIEKDDEPLDCLASLAAEESDDFDERSFIDAVSRNLRLGRFLLLIVGDGIREDVEKMTSFLQKTPQLGFTLGLVEVGLYRIDDACEEEYFVQPRVLARTVEVTRAVVEIRNHARTSVNVSVSLPEDEGIDTRVKRTSITEDEFLQELAAISSPRAVETAKWVLAHVEERGLDIEWGAGGPLIKYQSETTGHSFTLGQLNRWGVLAGFGWLSRMIQIEGLPLSIAFDYFDALTRCIPGSRRYDDGLKGRGKTRSFDVRMGPAKIKDRPTIEQIADNKAAWLDAMQSAALALQAALDERLSENNSNPASA